MAFNIDTFRQQGLIKGGARASLFEITFPTPRGIALKGLDRMTFLDESDEIPASSIQPITVPYFGRQIKLSGDRTFNDWQVTILNDEDFAIRDALETWHNKLNSLETNIRTVSEPGLYKAEKVKVTQFAKKGDKIREYEFVGMFPTEISNIALSWDTTNQIERFTCTFAYDYWLPVGTTTALGYNGQE